jgi:hypothetical protein
MLSRIHCLGHVISDEGITMDPVKVEDIMEWPTVTSLTINQPGQCHYSTPT